MRIWLIASLAIVFTGVATAADEPRHVIMISVDGLAGFYFDDDRASMPTIRRLAADGALCSQMKCSFPTVTWPNHTTLVTGVPPSVHGVLANNVIDSRGHEELKLIGDSRFDKVDFVRSPTIYDAAHQAGLTTSAVLWPATRSAPTLTWTLPDVYSGELFQRYATPGWFDELRAAGVPVDLRGLWIDADETGARCDWISTRAAVSAIEKHQPKLLLLHLLVCDTMQHKFGPRTEEAYWAISYADQLVRDVLTAVENAGLKSNTTVFIVSDHGFFEVEKLILPNVALKQAGLLTAKGRDVVRKDAYAISQGGAAPVYIEDRSKVAELTPRLVELFGKLEGVEQVFKAEQFAELGQPTPREHPWAPDLWLAAKRGYIFWHGVEPDEAVPAQHPQGAPTYRGMHGYLPHHRDMRGTFIVSGPGVKPGARVDEMSNTDVAPTIARVLKLEFPTAQGKPVEGALE